MAICQLVMMIFKKSHCTQKKDKRSQILANNELYHYSKELADILDAINPGMIREVAQADESVQEDSDTTLGRNSLLSISIQSEYSLSEAINATSSFVRPSRTGR